jgi:DNA-binding PadR family transcriptional regulator
MSRQRATQDPALLIMISLASGPKHGHAMMRDVEGFAGVHMGPGTLYGALTRLDDSGLVEPMAAQGRRRPYI